MIRNAPPKHPDSAKWYWLEWSEQELDAATIAQAAWVVPAGLTQDADAVSGRRAGIKLSGGTLDEDYELKLTIDTSGGETLNEHMIIRCRKSGH